MKLLYVLIALVVSTILSGLKTKNRNGFQKYKWIVAFSFIPLLVYYGYEIIFPMKDWAEIVIMTPFLYLFYFSFTWLFSSLATVKKQKSGLLIFQCFLLPVSFTMMTFSLLGTQLLPLSSEKIEFTKEDKQIIEKEYGIKLPDHIEYAWFYVEPAFQDTNYGVKLEMTKEEFNRIQKEFDSGHYPPSEEPSTNPDKVLVNFENFLYPSSEFVAMVNNKRLTKWNYLKQEYFSPNK